MPYKDAAAQKAAQKEHYLKNKDKYIKRNKTYRQKVREYVQEIKESKPCMDCGVSYPYYIMEFDHLHSKINSVAKLVSSGTMNQVILEIEKCELVCSNCHKYRTWVRLQK
jgi:hypothetical protein